MRLRSNFIRVAPAAEKRFLRKQHLCIREAYVGRGPILPASRNMVLVGVVICSARRNSQYVHRLTAYLRHYLRFAWVRTKL